MDDQFPSNGRVEPGVSLRNGPIEELDAPETNGSAAGKRKSRTSLGKSVSYAEVGSSEEDEKPLVRPAGNLDHFRTLDW